MVYLFVAYLTELSVFMVLKHYRCEKRFCLRVYQSNHLTIDIHSIASNNFNRYTWQLRVNELDHIFSIVFEWRLVETVLR